MDPFWRARVRTIFLIFAIFFIAGCQEYNPHPSISEVTSLSDITQLTKDFDRAGEAFFSPDARWIVFRAQPDNRHQYALYMAKIDANKGDITTIERPIRITPIDARSEGGSFSPDGFTLIFSSTAGAHSQTSDRFPIDMRIDRVDNWESTVSMTDASTGINLAEHPLITDHAYNGECRFSADGRHIVFTSTRDGNPNLYVMNADGTHIVQITRTGAYDGQASFSPNGKQLLYCSDRGTNHLNQIYVADLTFDSTGEITGLTDEHALTWDENTNTNPAWYPDGTHIIYSTSKHGHDNYELYLMAINGRRKTRITYSPGADLYPVFSPDGRYVMWTSKRAKDGTIQVFLAKFQFPLGS
jgi:TolB protein